MLALMFTQDTDGVYRYNSFQSRSAFFSFFQRYPPKVFHDSRFMIWCADLSSNVGRNSGDTGGNHDLPIHPTILQNQSPVVACSTGLPALIPTI